MVLFVPIIQEALEKARRSAKLVRKVQTVMRDGIAYQQAFWVLPEQAAAEGLPMGAQLDLFERTPDRPPEPPREVAPAVYLSQVPEDKPDEYTLKMRRLSADMVSFDTQGKPFKEALREHFNAGVLRSVYDLPPNSVGNLLYGVSQFAGESPKDMKRSLSLIARGDLGVDTGVNGHVVHSKYHGMPADDIARLYAAGMVGGLEECYKADAIYNEAMVYHRELQDIVFALRGMKPEELREVAMGRKSFAYRSGKKRMIFKAKAPVTSLPTAKVSGTPEEQVKALIAHGVNTYQDCIAIGKIVYEAAGAAEDETVKRFYAVKEEALSLYYQYKKKWAAREKATKTRPGEMDRDVEERFKKADNDYQEWRRTVYDPRTNELEEEEKRLKAKMAGRTDDTARRFLDFLGRIRPMGPGNIPFAQATYTGSADPGVVREAMSVFPTAWLEKLADHRVEFKNVKEGRGSAGRGVVRATWKPGMTGHSKATQAHEIGHEIERSAKLAEFCRQFVYSLSDDGNGGRVKNKRSAMRNWQKGLDSPHLPDQYAGVLYDWGDTEVVSMAAGGLYDNYDAILNKGAKYWHFILGLWAGV